MSKASITAWASILATATLLGNVSQPSAAEPISLALPIACEIGMSCFVQNYVDSDPSSNRTMLTETSRVRGVIAEIKSSAVINRSRGETIFSFSPSRSSIGFHVAYWRGNSPFAVTSTSTSAARMAAW